MGKPAKHANIVDILRKHVHNIEEIALTEVGLNDSSSVAPKRGALYDVHVV